MPANFAWIDEVEELSAAALTVDVQTAPDLNADDRLMYETLAPVRDVPSIKIESLDQISFRPVGGRRTWNVRGRQIPLLTPGVREIVMEPIETYFTIDEREIQFLEERFNGNQAMIVEEIKADVPARTRELAEANHRRIELDFFEAWVNRTVTVRNPRDNSSYAVPLEFDNARYGAAGTAWNNGAVNAYNEFIAWLAAMMPAVGAIAGVALRSPVIREIHADAPLGANGAKISLANLADRISQDTQSPFRFYNMDILPTLDDFVDGGIDTQPVNRWPSIGKIAIVPADQRVGNTARAPVGRAMSLIRQLQGQGITDSGIDVRGMSVFPESINNGRELNVEVQGNYFPLLNEKRLAVFDTGITS